MYAEYLLLKNVKGEKKTPRQQETTEAKNMNTRIIVIANIRQKIAHSKHLY